MNTTMMSALNIYGYVVAAVVVFLILLLWQRNRFFFASSPSSPSASLLLSDSINSNSSSRSRTSNFVTDADLKFLMEILDEKLDSDKWEDVLDKRNHHLCYSVKCCKPKNGPLKYLSKTVFNDISSEMLRNFYMDNDYRKQWDKTLVEHNQLQVDKSDVPGSNACEITMFHQEDAGLNTEMAKLAFRKGIWNYVCKMDNALRRYSVISYHLLSSVSTSVDLMQKVPACLDLISSNISPANATVFHDQVTDESQIRMILRRPSRKLIANGLLLLGGATAICLSRGHSSLGAKVAMAYIITKLSKRGARSNQSKQS
ncbi:hypothetical protein JHK85_017558 [Glycine max]|nr:hypothetical protein JHK85_017558 [Glycine max]